MEKNEHKCEYCKKVFVTEKTLFTHPCNEKRKVLSRGDRANVLGMVAYQEFWKKGMGSKHKPTWEEFEKSKLYGAFIRFGKYCADVKPVNQTQFIEFLIKMEINIDKWCLQTVYENYIMDLNRTESIDTAIERNMILMEKWAADNNQNWTDFFKLVSTHQATLWIKTGRISPWMLFSVDSAQDLLDRLSSEQMVIIEKIIDPSVWLNRLEKHHQEVDAVRQVMRNIGV